MTSTLGPYWSPWHRYQQDEDYLQRLDPSWTLIHQPQARDVATAQRLAPRANILLRSWDIDDSDGRRKQEMYADPKGAAKKHLDMWKVKWQELEAELHRNNWPYNSGVWYLQLVNEPDPAHIDQVVEYSLEAMRLVKGTLIHLGLVVSSVGTFSKPSENDNGWTKCIPLEGPINDGGHILVVHEYWQPEGPNFGEDGGNLAWRHHSIPLNVPILIGESGANGYIYQAHSQNDDAGWQKFMSPDQYATQVKEYIAGCDKRVQGVLLYMLDYHSDQWETFYTGPAMEQLLAIKDTRPQAPSPFAASTVHLPAISTGTGKPTTAYVRVASGANLRSAPTIAPDNILTAVPYAGAVTVAGYSLDQQWAQVTYKRVGDKSISGWMSSALLSPAPLPATQPAPQQPQPEPALQPTGDKWQRTIAFILGEEGGYTANDEGHPANFGINQGANPDLDVAHITREQAIERYRTAYWIASTADQQPWPFCLLVMDAAVQHGEGEARMLFKASNGNMLHFQGARQLYYANIEQGNWNRNGKAWMARMGRLLLEASKP